MRLAAARARGAVPAVHLEVLAQLRLRQPAGARALELEAVGEHRADRVEQRGALRRRRATRATRTATAARATARRRRSPRPTPETVRWSRRSVWTRRRSSPWSTSSANSSESGSGPSRSSGPSSPGASTHHAALRSCAVLAHEHRDVVAVGITEPEAHDRALGPGLLRRVARCRAARPARGGRGSRRGVAEVERRGTSPAARRRSSVCADERLRAGHDRLQRREPERLDRLERRAARARRRGARPAPASAAARARSRSLRPVAPRRQRARRAARCSRCCCSLRRTSSRRCCRSRNVSDSVSDSTRNAALHRLGVGRRPERGVDADLAHDPVAVRLARSTCRSPSSAGACRGRARGPRSRC